MPRGVLKYDVNPKTANTVLGLASLLRAAQDGHEGVVGSSWNGTASIPTQLTNTTRNLSRGLRKTGMRES